MDFDAYKQECRRRQKPEGIDEGSAQAATSVIQHKVSIDGEPAHLGGFYRLLLLRVSAIDVPRSKEFTKQKMVDLTQGFVHSTSLSPLEHQISRELHLKNGLASVILTYPIPGI